VSEGEAKFLYEEFAVSGSGEPQFQAAAANLNSWTEAKVDSKNPERGPHKRGKRNSSPTEIVEMKGRGHSLTVDSGGCEVADTALAFVKRFA
jgi:hypothetical protein